MVMSDLRIDGDCLRDAAIRIREVVDSFGTAGADAGDAATYVGHGGLARRVKEFANGWDIHRGRLSDELRQMADTLEAVVETFTDVDDRGAATLRQTAAVAIAPTVAAGRAASTGATSSLGGGRGE